MILAHLIQAWSQALRGAIARIESDGEFLFHASEAPLVAASPAQAFALAGDLAALIDDMIIEGVAWGRLDGLAPGDFDAYWRITLDFLKIAIRRRRLSWAHYHRRLDRDQSRDRAADRRHSAGAAGRRRAA
jgi:ATP-dependent helicase/nuclease subunit B